MWYVALWYTYYLVSTFCVQTSVAVESRGGILCVRGYIVCTCMW